MAAGRRAFPETGAPPAFGKEDGEVDLKDRLPLDVGRRFFVAERFPISTSGENISEAYPKDAFLFRHRPFNRRFSSSFRPNIAPDHNDQRG
jgi:hypothetical protein